MSEPMPPDPDDEPVIDYGVAGAGARREHGRRKSNREQRVRDRHPLTGGLRLALGAAPRHETQWATGANGEEMLATSLAQRCTPNVRILHDRRVPGSRANIDHIAVCANGVWVIDAKNYKGKVVIDKPWFGEAKLKIGDRDQTKLITGLERQIALVEAALAGVIPGVPVRGAIGFLGDGLPMWPKLSFRGCPILRPRALAKQLNQDGPLSPDEILRVTAHLAQRFPHAGGGAGRVALPW